MGSNLAALGRRVGIIVLALMFVHVSPISLNALADSPTQANRKLVLNEVKQLPEKSKRFALVIGVDVYQDTQISNLSGAANDAKALADTLVRCAGFPQDQVILLASDQPLQRQPTRGNILQYLSNLKGIVPESGLLLLSFAGHGTERGGRGYLCPADARIGGSLSLLESTAVPVDLVRDWIRDMGVKQVLIILDACRNNPMGRGDEMNRLTDSFAHNFSFEVRNREVDAFATLYATSVGNVAYEYKEKNQGYFTWFLVEGLKGAAANERGEVMLGALVRYLQDRVPKRVRLDLGEQKTQRPFVRVEGFKAEELVISVSVTAALTPVKPPVIDVDPGTIEREFWNSIKGSKDVGDFREYLAKYPNGTFAGLAKNKIQVLETVANPTPAEPVASPNTSVAKVPPVSTSSTGILGALKRGDDLYRAGKFNEAIEAYKDVLNQDPNNDQAVGYIGYSYNKLHDTAQARDWMKRRVELAGQSPSKKAQVLTDITLLYWDEAHMDIAARLANGTKTLKPEDVAGVKKLLVEGLDSATKAVAIAPRSIKGFNLMNLLYRASAAIETEPAVKTDLLAKADDALRKSIQFYEGIPQQQSTDLWTVPTLSALNGTELGQAAHFGVATKKPSPDVLKDAREGSVIVEVVVSRDGYVRLQRVLSGQGKPADVALASAHKWEFEPSTFEGHTVQVIETISFPVK